MIDALIHAFVAGALALRYRIRVRGREAVAGRGTRGILFLPNHPGLIDPIIVLSSLLRTFRPRALADADQIKRPVIGALARRINVVPLPDIRTHGPAAREQVAAMVRVVAEGLKRGENFVLYPSGHIYRTRHEDLRGNSAVEELLALVPDVRIVLVRTRGLWGSSFGLANTGGAMVDVGKALKRGLFSILANFIFFTPRREVTLDLHEPLDLPRKGGRSELNAAIERFYNEDAPPNTYVPYTIWEGGGPRVLPEPTPSSVGGSLASVPESTRQLVFRFLAEKTGNHSFRDSDQLATDLGLDSLAKAELVLWLGREFGRSDVDVDALQTVADVLLATRGEAVAAKIVGLKPPPRAWFEPRSSERVQLPGGETINAVFLAQARRSPGAVVVADQIRGALTYRDLVTAILVLKPMIEKLPGERVGIMLPASAGAATVYLATLFAGRTPVMVNWTTGTRNVLHSLELAGVKRVLTAAALVGKLKSQGLDIEPLQEFLAPLEGIGRSISIGTKLRAALRARLSWSALEDAKPPEHAVVLLTSGSESLPKAVPLTHANILANLRDALSIFRLRGDDVLMGFLPPFHSFGLAITTVLPLLGGMRVVYHANPTEAAVIARLTEAYRATVVCGTPTFLYGMTRAATGQQLGTLRLAVTGAEKCPERTYAALAERCPKAIILEGYGISECSPVVSANREERIKHGTIGQVLPSIEYAIMDVDRGVRVRPGEAGLLLVRGPSIFGGYLGDEIASPFVEFESKQWYRTGDLVSEDADSVLTFRGRLKRFVKLGGEMISLPAIEDVLARHYASENDEGPVVAVESTPTEDHPEIVLFTTRPDVDRATANKLIRDAGLSALHNLARVEQVDAIPLLGTGKTDYRALKARLAGA